jgi:MurNAc alpha-1-phosphate uridylyltransferase
MIKQAIVLAAGEGRRLRPLTETTPKPLIPIDGTTMLDHALDELARVGVEKCVVNTYHLATQIHDHVKTRKSPHIIISHESELLDTGGGIVNALPNFNGQPFYALNADIWWRDIDGSCLQKLNNFWNADDMDALLLLTPKEQGIGFEGRGDYDLKADGRIQFRGEKDAAPYIHNGIRILHPRLFADQNVHPFSMMTSLHQAEKNGRLYGLVFEGEWGDIGTLESLRIIKNYVE